MPLLKSINVFFFILALVNGIVVDNLPQDDLPTVKLSYGTWRAAKHDKVNDVGAISNENV
jgi:hypothetical protein